MSKEPKVIKVESIERGSYKLPPFEIVGENDHRADRDLTTEDFFNNYVALLKMMNRPKRVWFKPWTWFRRATHTT